MPPGFTRPWTFSLETTDAGRTLFSAHRESTPLAGFGLGAATGGAGLSLCCLRCPLWPRHAPSATGSFLRRDLSLGSSEKASEWHSRSPAGLHRSRLSANLQEDSHCRQPEVSTEQTGVMASARLAQNSGTSGPTCRRSKGFWGLVQ